MGKVCWAFLLAISLGGASESYNYKASEHGLLEELSAEEMAAIRVWAENSKVALEDLLLSVDGISDPDERLKLLEDGMGEIVETSSHKGNELFLRYALNRGIYMSEIVRKESDSVLDTRIPRLRMLEYSIQLAMDFFQHDIRFLEWGEDPRLNRVAFAKAWFQLNINLAKKVWDASAQYNVLRFGLGRLQVDLGHSAEKERYANDIRRIDNLLGSLGEENLDRSFDQGLLDQIRRMVGVRERLEIVGSLRGQRNVKAGQEPQAFFLNPKRKKKEVEEKVQVMGEGPSQNVLDCLDVLGELGHTNYESMEFCKEGASRQVLTCMRTLDGAGHTDFQQRVFCAKEPGPQVLSCIQTLDKSGYSDYEARQYCSK